MANKYTELVTDILKHVGGKENIIAVIGDGSLMGGMFHGDIYGLTSSGERYGLFSIPFLDVLP